MNFNEPLATLGYLFQKISSLYPDHIALIEDDITLTYKEVDYKARLYAQTFSERGIRAGDYIGLYAERSTESIICIIALLYLGAVYVPFDPHMPTERICAIANSSKIKYLISNSTKITIKGLNPEITIIDLDNISFSKKIILKLAATKSNQLAYIIHTSGSTGKPKGVMVSHANVIATLRQSSALYKFGNSDRWLLFHNLAFDFSIWELFGALLHAATLVVYPQNKPYMVDELVEILIKNKITILNQTPSVFYQLAEYMLNFKKMDTLYLRYVIFGGEKLKINNLKKWYNHLVIPKPTLVNMYGITEITIHATFYQITESDMDKEESIIGQPLPETQFYVLSEDGAVLPPGEAGELAITGPGVSLGYLGSPSLTREKFINLTVDSELLRAYKTGDRVKQLINGNYEYVDRLDRQIKVRGFRIEPTEIELVINSSSLINWSMVVKYEQELIAFVLVNPLYLKDKLLTMLKNRLPDYMIPTRIIPINQIPLTKNGKVDVVQLIASLNDDCKCEKEPVTLQHKLRSIWEKILKHKDFNEDDSFFSVGGHSLSATELSYALTELFSFKIPLRKVFELTTINEQAEWLETQIK